ncbi:tRNA pseudouridine(38-40) synthase TruA [Pseudoclavibacter chungangensis]|uniref:tRNA pseudouridine synthase A n=1 Tax=Pseudoclavibacter chungangensis TaxID=587635 RepID=A0A7J5C114_9MICO|nr:tRNA pseudouridine(38-40) synthase TruA [Pseudoclavibacter chungangensis]KAB1662316.1 tRNA pseudouridine(38-40) synthase TruA [Pseudoclavibacter chungangensis]NYJ65525.1 tRNA pseudouridine38-40 synthase [Pseudoclavibacter chungangensis]
MPGETVAARDADANGGPVRVRVDIAYDGTAFSGWAAQPRLRTVQGVLEEALRILYRDLPAGPLLTVAGRTDAGVHALGQVAHLDLPAEAWERTARRGGREDAANALVRRLGGVLGADSDVVVTDVALAPPGFDARFSALWRRYEYRLADLDAPTNPLERHRTAQVRQRLDLDAMNEAAALLVGLHDFAGFCKPRAHATTIRTLQEFAWTRDERGVFTARVRADAFCHSMVRSLVGMCAAAGAGRLELGRVAELLHASERSNAFPVLAARGLTLLEIGYPEAERFAVRAEQTRARRHLTLVEAEPGEG